LHCHITEASLLPFALITEAGGVVSAPFFGVSGRIWMPMCARSVPSDRAAMIYWSFESPSKIH
jgi:hypothetical protein